MRSGVREANVNKGYVMRAPKDCKDMPQLRQQIDELDRKLVRLLAERLTYVDRAAEIKKRDMLPANIPARVEEVVEKIVAEGHLAGLPSELAEGLWRQMIDFSIAREELVLNAPEENSDDS